MTESDVLEYAKAARIGVVAVRMNDSSPHAATVHVACVDDDLTFVIQTTPTYRKAEPLHQGETLASLVLGFKEGLQTLQMDGVSEIVDPSSTYAKKYLDKFPEKAEQHPGDIFFTFKPTWWRMTDWDQLNGKTTLDSEGNKRVFN